MQEIRSIEAVSLGKKSVTGHSGHLHIFRTAAFSEWRVILWNCFQLKKNIATEIITVYTHAYIHPHIQTHTHTYTRHVIKSIKRKN